MAKAKSKTPPAIPSAPNLTPPEKCDECGNDRFRQEGEKFICKACGHEH